MPLNDGVAEGGPPRLTEAQMNALQERWQEIWQDRRLDNLDRRNGANQPPPQYYNDQAVPPPGTPGPEVWSWLWGDGATLDERRAANLRADEAQRKAGIKRSARNPNWRDAPQLGNTRGRNSGGHRNQPTPDTNGWYPDGAPLPNTEPPPSMPGGGDIDMMEAVLGIVFHRLVVKPQVAARTAAPKAKPSGKKVASVE